jgi:hypothetical protein
MISNAAQRFDERGELTDETSTTLIRQPLEALATRRRRLHASPA